MAKTPRSHKEANSKVANNKNQRFSINEKYFTVNEKSKKEHLQNLFALIKGEK